MRRIEDEIKKHANQNYEYGPITQEEGERIIRNIFSDWDESLNKHYDSRVRIAATPREWLTYLAQLEEHMAYIIVMAYLSYALGYEPKWEHTAQIDFIRHTAKREIDYNCNRQISRSKNPNLFADILDDNNIDRVRDEEIVPFEEYDEPF
ncbi:MAG: hypothetical protein IKE74_05470 [Mogibacterium sp.]|nr:hypothetical protein [Mogibacterium sp.]